MTLVPPSTWPNSILTVIPLGRCPISQIRTLRCKWGYITDFRSFCCQTLCSPQSPCRPPRVCNTASPCQESVRTPHATSLAVAPVCSHVPRHPVTGPWLHLPCDSVITHSTAPQGEVSGSAFSHAPGKDGWVPAECRTRWGVWPPARGSAQRPTENLLKHKQQQEKTCPWEVSGSSDSLTGTTSGSITGRTELQAWNGECVKGSRANCWSWSLSIFKTMPLGTSAPRVQPKSSGSYSVAVLPAVHPGLPTGLAWEEETQESPLAEACRVGRSHQFAVLAPRLPKGPQMGGEGPRGRVWVSPHPPTSRIHGCMTGVTRNPKQQTSSPRH